ncbi:peptidase C39 [Helicobacter aurati]|uniref:Peptidase C39 n=1 Tax=Helicobacter aurati TaxID=137778 RepID=A0A3D8J328_9HELI|nr:C39 family peptidase [Helicobacter aurati]RDU71927.1 peptidase C39 [Helicobacter aurati]
MKFAPFVCLCLSFCCAEVFINIDSTVLQKNITSWTQIRDGNLIKQKYDYSCGSASLATILNYYYHFEIGEKEILDSILLSKGIDSSKKEEIENDEELRKEANLSFLDLANYAQKKGMKALGLALTLESLAKLKAPVIIYVKIRDNEHFTVYKGIDKHFVYLADPSFGNIKVSLKKFQEMFYQRKDLHYPGKILAITPGDNTLVGDESFMKTKHDTTFVYDVIKDTIGR